MIKKNEEYIVEIIDNGFEGEGIAKIDRKAVFIPDAIKGEKIKIKILKVLKNQAFGKIVEIIEKSEFRKEIDCQTFNRCGGCNLRHIEYENTLQIKKDAVETTVKKALGRQIEISEILGMDNPYNYRNKLQYPVGINELGETVMGVYALRSHQIIPTQNCAIQDKLSQHIANDIFDFILKNNIKVYD